MDPSEPGEKREQSRPTRKESAKSFIREVTYPHSIHPALVPGVSVEDQRIRYSVDWRIVSVVGGLIVAFIAWGVVDPNRCLTPRRQHWPGSWRTWVGCSPLSRPG